MSLLETLREDAVKVAEDGAPILAESFIPSIVEVRPLLGALIARLEKIGEQLIDDAEKHAARPNVTADVAPHPLATVPAQPDVPQGVSEQRPTSPLSAVPDPAPSTPTPAIASTENAPVESPADEITRLKAELAAAQAETRQSSVLDANAKQSAPAVETAPTPFTPVNDATVPHPLNTAPVA